MANKARGVTKITVIKGSETGEKIGVFLAIIRTISHF